MEKTLVTKNHLIISIILYGGNTILFLFYLQELFSNLYLIKYLTQLSYYANSIYLFLCLICDIFLYLSNNLNEENNYQLLEEQNDNNSLEWYQKLNDWNRNKYGIICNTFSFFVSISFWILYFLGKHYIRVSNSFNAMLSTINLHLVISILIIFISIKKKQFLKPLMQVTISIKFFIQIKFIIIF